MKFVVLGATGGTGLEIVRQAIEHGHSVTAFVRTAERLKPFGNRIIIQQGDLLNPAELAKAISGHDAILSGFGPRVPIAKADANLLQNFATALTTAMQRDQRPTPTVDLVVHAQAVDRGITGLHRGGASRWIGQCHLPLLPLVPPGQSPASPPEALR